MDSILKTRLKILVNSGIPSNYTLVDTEEAEYILTIDSELKELHKHCAELENHIVDLESTANNRSKGVQ